MNKGLRRTSVITIAILLISMSFVCTILAKYFTSKDGAGTQPVAKWEFVVNDSDTSHTHTESKEFCITATPETKSSVRTGYIAPGVGGSFEIQATNKGDVQVEYTIEFSVTNKPTNVKFYYNNSGTLVEITETSGIYTYDFGNGNSANDGILEFGANPGDAVSETVTIYWAWDFDTPTPGQNDTADTTDGISANEMKILATVTGTQKA